MSPILLTVGYEDHATPKSLVDLLVNARVERLLDVRELPLSRRKGFSKRALGAAVEKAGIRYEHERALGNPKEFRHLYRSGAQAAGERGYLSHIRNGSAWAVDQLATSLEERVTCMLCFEADHKHCHRSLIVQELRQRIPDLQVQHL